MMNRTKHRSEKERLQLRLALSVSYFGLGASFARCIECTMWIHAPFVYQNLE